MSSHPQNQIQRKALGLKGNLRSHPKFPHAPPLTIIYTKKQHNLKGSYRRLIVDPLYFNRWVIKLFFFFLPKQITLREWVYTTEEGFFFNRCLKETLPLLDKIRQLHTIILSLMDTVPFDIFKYQGRWESSAAAQRSKNTVKVLHEMDALVLLFLSTFFQQIKS